MSSLATTSGVAQFSGRIYSNIRESSFTSAHCCNSVEIPFPLLTTRRDTWPTTHNVTQRVQQLLCCCCSAKDRPTMTTRGTGVLTGERAWWRWKCEKQRREMLARSSPTPILAKTWLWLSDKILIDTLHGNNTTRKSSWATEIGNVMSVCLLTRGQCKNEPPEWQWPSCGSSSGFRGYSLRGKLGADYHHWAMTTTTHSRIANKTLDLD